MQHDKGAPSLDIEFEAAGHDLDAAIDAALTAALTGAAPVEAMVDRALDAYNRSRGTYAGEVPTDRDDMRAALTAALTPSTGTAPGES